jgi:hypothetical protein
VNVDALGEVFMEEADEEVTEFEMPSGESGGPSIWPRVRRWR